MHSRILWIHASRGIGVAGSAAYRTRRSSVGGATVPIPTAGTGLGGVSLSSSTLRYVAAAGAPQLLTAARGVQFEQTSQMIDGINKGNKAQATKWITKSTKDYMQEADSKLKGNASLVSIGRERIKESSVKRRERVRQVAEEGEATMQLEMDRIRDDKDRRWKKGINFFKRQGKAFFLLYLSVYIGTFALLYVGFASGLIKKEAAFEFLFIMFGSFIDRDSFYKRIEAWDTYINVGFAFVINELLEVLRLPFVMMLFYQCRPMLTGVNARIKKSIFRWNAAEK